MKFGVVAVIAGLLSVGCGKSKSEQKQEAKAAEDRERAALTEKVAKDGAALFAKVKALIKALPAAPVTKIPYGTASEDNSILLSSDPAETERALDGQSGTRTSWMPTKGAQDSVAQMVAHQEVTQMGDPAKWLAQVKYAVVLTPISYVGPKLVDGGFAAGHRTAELRIYELASGKYVGGQVVHATNDQVVWNNRKGNDPTAVEVDLREKFSWAVWKALGELTPGASIASPPGAAFTGAGWTPYSAASAISLAAPVEFRPVGGASIPEQLMYITKGPDAAQFAIAIERETQQKFHSPDECKGLIANWVKTFDNTPAVGEPSFTQADGGPVCSSNYESKHWIVRTVTVDHAGSTFSIVCTAPPGTPAPEWDALCDRVWATREWL